MDSMGADLQQYLQIEQQRAMANQVIAKITSDCWDKCITDTPGKKFSKSESNCLNNCAKRYVDLCTIIAQRLQTR